MATNSCQHSGSSAGAESGSSHGGFEPRSSPFRANASKSQLSHDFRDRFARDYAAVISVISVISVICEICEICENDRPPGHHIGITVKLDQPCEREIALLHAHQGDPLRLDQVLVVSLVLRLGRPDPITECRLDNSELTGHGSDRPAGNDHWCLCRNTL